MSGGGFRVWPHRGLEKLCPPYCLVLIVRPQAELAASHKCLSHEVKRLTEENQGLRAEQLPSSARRGLEQDEGQEASLPSSVPVRGVWALSLGTTLSVLPFCTQQSIDLGPLDSGADPGCCVLAVSPQPTQLDFSKAQFPHLKMGAYCLLNIGMKMS